MLVYRMNVIEAAIERRGALVLDGALATELERMGSNLDCALWSAEILLHAPERIGAVHRNYLEVGCDIISSASYQATVAGFVAGGQTRQSAEDLFRESIRLAGRERNAFAESRGQVGTERPLVAVSLGPYGAYLADGSEYRGRYTISESELERFHVSRLELAAEEIQNGHADLVALETVPSLSEACILARLLDTLWIPGWISFACRDAQTTCEGQDALDCARALDAHDFVVGVGVNCTPPEFVPDLIECFSSGTTKPLVAYPNSGEVYDPETRSWSGVSVLQDIDSSAAHWSRSGASLLGGCCRTTPQDMARIVAWRDRHYAL